MSVQLAQPYADPSTILAPWPATPITHVPSPGYPPLPIEQPGAELEALVVPWAECHAAVFAALREGGYYLTYGPVRSYLAAQLQAAGGGAVLLTDAVWARVAPQEQEAAP